jgi:hypothetical protein
MSLTQIYGGVAIPSTSRQKYMEIPTEKSGYFSYSTPNVSPSLNPVSAAPKRQNCKRFKIEYNLPYTQSKPVKVGVVPYLRLLQTKNLFQNILAVILYYVYLICNFF